MSIITTSRRDFIKTGVVGLGSAFMLPSCLKGYTPWQFFTEEEATCMAAICEQIIPSDEYGPGAGYAGVIYYIDKQLDEVFTWDQEDYRKGIAAIQDSARAVYQDVFEELEPEVQHSFLKKMESNDLPANIWDGILTPSSLFTKMIQHSMQGFYGSPRHGGNKNYISYKLMKLEYPYIVGQNRYRELKDNELKNDQETL